MKDKVSINKDCIAITSEFEDGFMKVFVAGSNIELMVDKNYKIKAVAVNRNCELSSRDIPTLIGKTLELKERDFK